jgi:hypothetical protein
MDHIIERLRSEFLEMPGMRLTARQVQRLCGVDERVCHIVLEALVDTQFLRRGADGTYARVDEGPRARMAKVTMHMSRSAKAS